MLKVLICDFVYLLLIVCIIVKYENSIVLKEEKKRKKRRDAYLLDCGTLINLRVVVSKA